MSPGRGVHPAYQRLNTWLVPGATAEGLPAGRARSAGSSVEGRPLVRLELGDGELVVLLTALLHGLEWVGGVALGSLIERLAASPLLDRVRLVILPMVNPDAFAHTLAQRQGRGWGGRRTNARGVDLNRNFPPATERRFLHPFAGSSRRGSPHYRGPAVLSEPESRLVATVAREVRPQLALAFHSFGDLLLHPFSHTRAPHPRIEVYRALAAAFTGAQRRPYRVRCAYQLYPTVGDLDDWLDAELGTLSFTVEVGRLDRRLLAPRRAIDPFHWMNPIDPTPAATEAAAGAFALIESATRLHFRSPPTT